MSTAAIRSLFSTARSIDRPIEKVIDYYATEDRRLMAEVGEYEVTASVERNLQRFLETVGHGVRTGQVAETGVWVSGFYGSGKSSFTKYIGFALDPNRTVSGRPFLDLLAERIPSITVRQDLKTLVAQEPFAVVMLDLGSEQLASSSATSVSTVLYWKVLQWAGYSKEEKVAQLEFRLDRDGRLEEFRQAYRAQFGKDWRDVQNNPMVAVSHAAELAPRFYPQEYPDANAFRILRFSLAESLRDRVAEILDVVRRTSGHKNVLFLVDEAGQYVAPRSDLILNLQGLAQNLKELGQGRVWLVATGQQTLAEIIEKAAHNSTELNKLRDRFPMSIELDAQDIREITWRRLLTKSADGEAQLNARFQQHGQALATHTRISGSVLFKGDVDQQTFVRLYPFLPQHFDLLLELVRVLARRTGGIGLRSAIRVIQDVLVDSSSVLPPGTPLFVDQPIGRLATAELFFDTLRADIGKVLPHVVSGVDRVTKAFPGNALALRVAKAVAALQPIENFPRTVENLGALLYQQIGDPPQVEAVREVLRQLVEEKAVGLVDDPQTGGFAFLSEGVKPLREKRNSYEPTTPEVAQVRTHMLKSLFDSVPSATLEAAKTVRAGVRLGQRVPIVGEDEEVQVRLEAAEPGSWDVRRTGLLAETTGNPEWKTTIAWLIRPDEAVEDVLREIVRSEKILHEESESEADRDVASFLRAERRSAEKNQDEARKLYSRALLDGTLIFRGKNMPAGTMGSAVHDVANAVLKDAAASIYPSFHLVNIRPPTDLAAKFLGVERLDRMPSDLDPLGFVSQVAGRPRVDSNHPALAEALRILRDQLDQKGTPRLQGNALQDLFAGAPYGWSKDATRYVFSGLLLAGEIAFNAPGGVITVGGPQAADAVRSSQSFGRIGVGLRDGRPSLETLDRAASRLQGILGTTVLPLENDISAKAKEQLPSRIEPLSSLPTHLRLLELAGEGRAQAVIDSGRDMLIQDGAGTIAILGAVDCPFPDDLQWAKKVAEALTNKADRDIQEARLMVRAADDLEPLLSNGTLVDPIERQTLHDVVASEAFYTRLPDLRGITRSISERAARSYRAELSEYEADLAVLRAGLEAMLEWPLLLEEDRSEIVGHLTHAFPASAPDGQELSCLRLILMRHATLATLTRELEREVAKRLPPLPPPPGPGDKDPPPTVPFDVELGSIMRPAVIGTSDELDVWLAGLRAELESALATRAPIRIRLGSSSIARNGGVTSVHAI